MNYNLIATTIFTPIEYGTIGYSEEDAYNTFQKENIDCYLTTFKPLEWNFNPNHPAEICYIKLLVNKLDNERVVGLHYLGPNAGEVTQGYSVAMNMGATKSDFFNTVGIHPTSSEVILALQQKRSDGESVSNAGC